MIFLAFKKKKKKSKNQNQKVYMIRVKKPHILIMQSLLYHVQKYNPFTCGLKLTYMNVPNKTFYNSVEN